MLYFVDCFSLTFDSVIYVFSGCRRKDIQSLVEEHVKTLIIKDFDPKKADLIFTEEGSVSSGPVLCSLLKAVSDPVVARRDDWVSDLEGTVLSASRSVP